ncbi:M23 family metallopeptidase [Psychromicrobium xiongbiense]|uniref:M23 family metallopeptidase n=1 Tax=Psychromicrobium xiongbiense TaxID=3051184 RepID=UPI0025549213|nr:M23 family metallopeptidase [Psychromicrobium sp. YIM S02556]
MNQNPMTAQNPRSAGRRAVRSVRFWSAAAALGLAVGMLIPAMTPTVARADNLDDQAKQLQQQAAQVQSSLEFVDAGIAKAASDLTLYTGMLPAAQQALADAQNRVAAATAEVSSLAARVDLAQQNKNKITAQIAQDSQKTQDSQKLIAQIISQSYKNGGMPTGMSLLLGGDLIQSVDGVALAEQALRSQYAALDKLTQQNATNLNSQARLAAVEAEIVDLKAKADAALQAEQAAQNDAAAKKASLDKLLSDTTALSKELNDKLPQIQAQLADVKAKQQAVADQIAARQAAELAAWQEQQRAAAAARGNNNYVPAPVGSPSAFGLTNPYPGYYIISGFGWRATPPGTIDPYGTGSYLHSGVDFNAPCGTPAYAAAAGTVVGAGWFNNGGGNGVQISHGVIQGNALTTMYYHNTSVVVSVGQHVEQGQLIAYTGTSGNSNGCHAHFETWLNGKVVDPAPLL